MKTFLLYLSLCCSVCLEFSAEAFAGVDTSGGGKGVVCRGPNREIKSIELLDLWESRMIYGRPVVNKPAPLDVQVHEALHSLRNSLHTLQTINGPGDKEDTLERSFNQLADLFLKAHAEVRYLKGVQLTLTPDSFEVSRPSDPGCEIEQIVVYQDTPGGPTIFVNNDLYSLMSETQKAALIVHEAVYGYLRNFSRPELNSIRVRRAVGLAFAGYRFQLPKEFSPFETIVCNSPIGPWMDPLEYIQVELFRVPAPGGARVLLRTDMMVGHPIFGLMEGPLTGPNEHLFEQLRPGTTPPSLAGGRGQRLSFSWLTPEMRQIENESDLRFEIHDLKNGTYFLSAELAAHSQHQGSFPPINLVCHGPNAAAEISHWRHSKY